MRRAGDRNARWLLGIPVIAAAAGGLQAILVAVVKHGFHADVLYPGANGAMLGFPFGVVCALTSGRCLSRKKQPKALYVFGLTVLAAVLLSVAGLLFAKTEGWVFLVIAFLWVFDLLLAPFVLESVLPDMPKPDPLACRQCGYCLRGSLASGRCPECGQSFDTAGR